MSNAQCNFSYRSSVFKQEADRYVILNVTFQLRKGEASLPITYIELANYLGINLGERAEVAKVRQAVLELRGRKGMLLNPADTNTYSAGSFLLIQFLTKPRLTNYLKMHRAGHKQMAELKHQLRG